MTRLAFSSSSDYEHEHPPLEKLKTLNQGDLHEIAIASDRISLPDLAGAAAADVALKACGIVSGSNTENAIEVNSKVRSVSAEKN